MKSSVVLVFKELCSLFLSSKIILAGQQVSSNTAAASTCLNGPAIQTEIGSQAPPRHFGSSFPNIAKTCSQKHLGLQSGAGQYGMFAGICRVPASSNPAEHSLS